MNNKQTDIPKQTIPFVSPVLGTRSQAKTGKLKDDADYEDEKLVNQLFSEDLESDAKSEADDGDLDRKPKAVDRSPADKGGEPEHATEEQRVAATLKSIDPKWTNPKFHFDQATVNNYAVVQEIVEKRQADEKFDKKEAAAQANNEMHAIEKQGAVALSRMLTDKLDAGMQPVVDLALCSAFKTIINPAMDYIMKYVFILYRMCIFTPAGDSNHTYWHLVERYHFALRLLLRPVRETAGEAMPVVPKTFLMLTQKELKDRLDSHDAQDSYETIRAVLPSGNTPEGTPRKGKGKKRKGTKRKGKGEEAIAVEYKTATSYLRAFRRLMCWYADYIEPPKGHSTPTQMYNWDFEVIKFDFSDAENGVSHGKYTNRMQCFYRFLLTRSALRKMKWGTRSALDGYMLGARDKVGTKFPIIQHTIRFDNVAGVDENGQPHTVGVDETGISHAVRKSIREGLWKSLHLFALPDSEAPVSTWKVCSKIQLENVNDVLKETPHSFNVFLNAVSKGDFLEVGGTMEFPYDDALLPNVWRQKNKFLVSYNLYVSTPTDTEPTNPNRAGYFRFTRLSRREEEKNEEENSVGTMTIDGYATKATAEALLKCWYLDEHKLWQDPETADKCFTRYAGMIKQVNEDLDFLCDGVSTEPLKFQDYLNRIGKSCVAEFEKLLSAKKEGSFTVSDSLVLTDLAIATTSAYGAQKHVRTKTETNGVNKMTHHYFTKGISIAEFVPDYDKSNPHHLLRNVVVFSKNSENLDAFIDGAADDRLNEFAKLLQHNGDRMYIPLTVSTLEAVVRVCLQCEGYEAELLSDVQSDHPLLGGFREDLLSLEADSIRYCLGLFYFTEETVEQEEKAIAAYNAYYHNCSNGAEDPLHKHPVETNYHWVCLHNVANGGETECYATATKVDLTEGMKEKFAEANTGTDAGTNAETAPSESATQKNAAVSSESATPKSAAASSKSRIVSSQSIVQKNFSVRVGKDDFDKIFPTIVGTNERILKFVTHGNQVYSVKLSDVFPVFPKEAHIVNTEDPTILGKVESYDHQKRAYVVRRKKRSASKIVKMSIDSSVAALLVQTGQKITMGGETYTVTSYDISTNVLLYICKNDKSGEEAEFQYDPTIKPIEQTMKSVFQEMDAKFNG